MPDVPTTGSVVAGYRIAHLIGRGATGAVYLAEDAEGGQVALKLLIPELTRDKRFRERFLREAQIALSGRSRLRISRRSSPSMKRIAR